MSKVKNEATIKDPIVKAVREQLEHRALWLYLLCDEAGKRGLSWEDFGSAGSQALRPVSGCGPCEKGRHAKPEGAAQNAVYQTGAVDV